MSSKKELIQELLDMQRKFIEFEHKNGVHPDDYYNPGAGHELGQDQRSVEAFSVDRISPVSQHQPGPRGEAGEHQGVLDSPGA